MKPYVLSIDQGTTSSRAILFNANGKSVATAQRELQLSFPHDGWVEQNPLKILDDVVACCRQIIQDHRIDVNQIAALGITNQRETTIVWNRHTGNPIYPAIVWQDRRTAEVCEKLAENHKLVAEVQGNTGLLLDPYFSASKIQWILENVNNARHQAESGELLFGTVDSFLIWHLTGGKQHKTDATNASRTMLYNLHTGDWDKSLCKVFNIPFSMLPEVSNSADNYGSTDPEIFGSSISIAGVAGDQHAALFGQTCFEVGQSKCTYGTGAFMMVNTGDEVLHSNHKLLTTVAYQLDGKATYALEGSIFMAGATVQWMRDGMQLFKESRESETLAEQAHRGSQVFMIPAFTGLGAPYWDPHARGALVGMTRDTGIPEIVAAGLQSVGYQTKDLQIAMHKDGVKLSDLRVDGGMSHNNFAMSFLADIVGCDVTRPIETETTALGVAYLAGLQSGVFSDLEQINKLWQADKRFEPRMSEQQRDIQYHDWNRAVQRITG